MKKIYLLSSDHLEDGLWFRDEEDFKVAMNYVAIQAALHPEVVILAFILMSNHVHFLLRGRREDVLTFITEFKQRYALYYFKKYGVREFLRRNGLDVKLIPADEDEAVERTVAYVQMNCVAANICAHPSQYPWGTGDTFFRASKPAGKRLDACSARQRERLLRSRCDKIPGEWLLTDDGYIHPGEYVAVKGVEALFRSPKRMNFFLRNSSKARKRLESAEEHLPAFRDQIILAAVPELCRSLFFKESFHELQTGEQVEIVRQIRFRFSADANQIARVCGITYAEAARLLDDA